MKKTKFKKFIACCLAMAIIFTMIPINTVRAIETTTSGNWQDTDNVATSFAC